MHYLFFIFNGDCKHVKLKLHVYFSELQDFGSNGEEMEDARGLMKYIKDTKVHVWRMVTRDSPREPGLGVAHICQPLVIWPTMYLGHVVMASCSHLVGR